jgi:hypothetical protein
MAATEEARRSAAVRVARVNILLYEGARDFRKKPRYASTSFIVSLVRSALSKPFGNRSQRTSNILHMTARTNTRTAPEKSEFPITAWGG